jgi:flagellar motility protein MotE (MotC chaperone)
MSRKISNSKEGVLMKKVIIFAIIVIVLLCVVAIIITMNKSHEAERITQQQYDAEKSEKLHFEVERSANLQSEADQNEQLQREAELNTKLQAEAEANIKLQHEYEQQEKLDYGLMCQHIEDNNDKIESVAKKLISVYEEFDYDRAAVNNGFFRNDNAEGLLEFNTNIDSLYLDRHFGCSQNNGYSFAFFEFPGYFEVFEYCNLHSKYHYFSKRYYIIYIPDEYLDESSIASLNESYNGTLRNVKDNLFTMWILEDPF